MKMFKFYVLFLMGLFATSMQAQNDSIKTKELQEVVVTADGQIEMSNKTLLLPTQLEKKHSANGFNLLEVMQTPDLEVSARTKSITTHSGGEVVLCINGLEALPEDVASLNAKNIRNIEYIRTPSGKYAGKAGLVNFVTIKMNYGGNVYLSASEGLAYQSGEYLAFADYKKKQFTLSMTASGDWARDHSYGEGYEKYIFSDKTLLERNFMDDNSLQKKNGQSLRLRLTSSGNSHRLNTYVSLVRQAVPSSHTMQTVSYSEPYGKAQRFTSSNSQALAPSLYANYSLWLPKKQIFDITASASIGHNKYHSQYSETQQSAMNSVVTENNVALSGNVQYNKSYKNGGTLTGLLRHDHKYYKDSYGGTAIGQQKLTTDVTVALVQASRSGEKYFYYVSAGLSNSAISLNGTHYNYCLPVAYYGGNYVFSNKHSLSLNGLFTHTLFDPSDKNSMIIPTSFFEATCGNPDLAPMKVLGNTLSYNGTLGKSRLSVSYDSNIYFDNIVHQYSASPTTIFDTRVNGGTFYGNMFTASYSYNLFNDHLRLSATAIEEYNMLRGDAYHVSHNVFRMQGSVVYLTGEWMLSFDYHTPYTSLDIHQPWFMQRRPVYEWKMNWNHKAWTAEILVRNPFSRFDKQHITMDDGCYNRDSWKYSEFDGRNVNLTLTYSLSYGKKSERGDVDAEKQLDSAIMKTY